MNKMLVAVFETEASAFEGLSALRELHQEGDITLYASAVVVKDKAGKNEVKQAADQGPVGTAVGLVTGSLIGLLAGPAGLLVGASLGGLGGLAFDLDSSGISAAFLDEVSKELSPGKAAVLADVGETWMTPVDTRLHKLGATVFRRLRSEVIEDQLMRESAAFEAELKALQDDLKHAAAENRAAIQKDMEQVKLQINTVQEQAKKRLDQARAETDARIQSLTEQAKQASDRAKRRIDKRIAEVKADFDVRAKKLNQAWTLTREALAA
ncbi:MULTISPECIES: DUF1269 domain-containing protein [unclassified Bradyrhizobium]|uniref:DUF1269 domain-containing protein n=1 Tax=unclassified Bradyrhizobium TaxID=2631580 RepID=UPI002305CD15|nr:MULTISPECIES: DUF1269 domain-containing protein [unclassified Bradyrhizobium]MDA9411052.1 hypothetical protein [Bradyrhizobium sp. CCBAU 45384]MDA9442601.1 hypothetical protein [Bradyrhizobium sp. CCBAU 51745]